MAIGNYSIGDYWWLFYKVSMLESTNATSEGKMQVYFYMLDYVRS
jgi:hypothetical protein